MYVYVEKGIAHFVNGDSVDKIDTAIMLKTCPKCASFDKLDLHRNTDYVYCKTCGISGPSFDGSPDDAVREWNSFVGK